MTTKNEQQKEENTFAPITIEQTEMDERDGKILMAHDALESNKPISHYRRLLFNMSMDFARDPKKGCDESDVADLMHLFELIN